MDRDHQPKQLGAWLADVDMDTGDSGDDPAGASWRAVFRNALLPG